MRRAYGQTRATSPRQLPTDHDYAASTREYQSDQPSQKPLDRQLALSSSGFLWERVPTGTFPFLRRRLRTVLAVKGSLRRAQARALDCVLKNLSGQEGKGVKGKTNIVRFST